MLSGTRDLPLLLYKGKGLDKILSSNHAHCSSYTLRPRTAVRVVSSRTPAQPPATRLTTTGNCRGITISDYNVENLSPGASNEQALATQIVQFLKSPDILALQEIQDNNGAIDNGGTMFYLCRNECAATNAIIPGSDQRK